MRDLTEREEKIMDELENGNLSEERKQELINELNAEDEKATNGMTWLT